MVVDASFAFSVVTGERLPTLSAIERLSTEPLIAPPLFRFEVANALLMATRRKRFTDVEVDQFAAEVALLPVEADPSSERRVWTATLALARLHTLSVYDAAYLELAIRLDRPLATFDSALAAAAEREAVEVIQ